jgi:hypothetical protein
MLVFGIKRATFSSDKKPIYDLGVTVQMNEYEQYK